MGKSEHSTVDGLVMLRDPAVWMLVSMVIMIALVFSAVPGLIWLDGKSVCEQFTVRQEGQAAELIWQTSADREHPSGTAPDSRDRDAELEESHNQRTGALLSEAVDALRCARDGRGFVDPIAPEASIIRIRAVEGVTRVLDAEYSRTAIDALPLTRAQSDGILDSANHVFVYP